MEGMIRVVHVFGILDQGGAENMIMNLYRKIDREKVQFDFVVHSEKRGFFEEEIKRLGGNIYRVPRYQGKNTIKYILAWSELFKQHPEWSIVHSHIRSSAVIYLWIAHRYGLKTVVHSHSISSGNGMESWAKSLLQYPLRFICDYYLACSLEAGMWLFGKRVARSSHFFVLRNAIDLEAFIYKEETRNNKRTEIGINDEYVIGHVGRFEYPKNHSFIVKLFEYIHEKNPNTLLLLIGSGTYENEVRDFLEKKNLMNSVIILNNRTDVSELMQAMDVFLFPSLYEGLGLAAIEAQATGLHVIASKEGVPVETAITDQLKFISLSSSLGVWCEEIMTLYSNRRTPVEEIKASGYDIRQTSKWLQDFYCQIEKTRSIE